MSDPLIARLVEDLRPVSAHAVAGRFLAVVALGFVVSAALMIAWLGVRPDLSAAAGTAIFWIKAGYTGALALAGIWATEQLARPGHSGKPPLILGSGIILALGAAAVIDYMLAPISARRIMLLGSSALVCPFYIAGLSVPFLVGNIILVRRLAPTNLTLAGAATGLMAGGLGASVYAFHCTEEGVPFLALWYTAGVAVVVCVGAALGKRLLRW